MSTAGFEEIDRFLAEVGRESLFDYYGASPDAEDAELSSLISARRRWAQAQQANPKFRNEARWLIRNQAAIKNALLEERAAYRQHLDEGAEDKNLELLSLFIRGTMFSGRFTPDAEQAIRRQAERLAIPEEVLNQRIEELLQQNDAVRAREAPKAPAPPPPPPQTPPRPDEGATLNARLREIFAQNLMAPQEVERILGHGREHGFSPRQILLRLDAAVLKSQGIVTTPPPRRPATWQTVSPMDKDKLREVVDALRGAMMQDTLGESMERLLQGQARKAGLSGEIWSGLLGTAKHHLTSFRGGLADPSAVLGMSTGRDRQEARRAYTQLRRWAWTHPDPLKCASTSLELDAAWAAILRS
jgi:hypothetical protein